MQSVGRISIAKHYDERSVKVRAAIHFKLIGKSVSRKLIVLAL